MLNNNETKVNVCTALKRRREMLYSAEARVGVNKFSKKLGFWVH